MGLLYTKMKVFHFKEKVDSLPAGIDKIMSPLCIRIKPTNACNHGCRYCSYRTNYMQLGKDMVEKDFIPREKMTEITEDIIEMGVKAVIFSGGGEPLCYPYLTEAVKKLSRSSVKFAALTNGSLLRGEIADIFAHNAQWLRVSMDGWDDKSYSDYRGIAAGEFSKIIVNMKNFKKIGGRCYLGVYIIVDKKNVTHIYELIKKLKDLGVNSVKIAPCIVGNSGKENNDYHRPIFDKAKLQIEKAKNEFAEEGFEIYDSYHKQLDTFDKEYKWCPYIQIVPVIGADMNVYPCHDKAYNLDEGLIGSIKDISFKDFWFSRKKKFFKIDPSRHCNHHCMVDANNKLLLDYLNADKEHLVFV